jgi:hypothetical protein
MMKSYGRIAYETCCRTFKTQIDPEIPWVHLTQLEKDFWEEIAGAVRDEVLERETQDNDEEENNL